jgi:hypothetical protein
MVFVMLDPRFKNLRLVSSFVGQEEGVNIMDEYDRRILYPRFLKCYHHLHSMIESVGCVDQIVMKIFVWIFFNILHPQMSH